MSIAELIKAARKAAGLTQKELGERMGVSDASIAQYESGQRNPKIDTIVRISEALNVPIDQLFGMAKDVPISCGHLLDRNPITFESIFNTDKNKIFIDEETGRMYQHEEAVDANGGILTGLAELSEAERQTVLDFVNFLKSKKGADNAT